MGPIQCNSETVHGTGSVARRARSLRSSQVFVRVAPTKIAVRHLNRFKYVHLREDTAMARKELYPVQRGRCVDHQDDPSGGAQPVLGGHGTPSQYRSLNNTHFKKGMTTEKPSMPVVGEARYRGMRKASTSSVIKYALVSN